MSLAHYSKIKAVSVGLKKGEWKLRKHNKGIRGICETRIFVAWLGEEDLKHKPNIARNRKDWF